LRGAAGSEISKRTRPSEIGIARNEAHSIVMLVIVVLLITARRIYATLCE
jgi:hypothetical protein